MRCDEVRTLLDDHVDSEAPAEVAKDIGRHLENCESCRAEERALRDLVEQLRTLPKTMASSADGWPEIDRRLDELSARAPSGSTRRVVWRGLAAASLLVAAFTAGYFIRPVVESDRASATDRPPAAALDAAGSGAGLDAAEQALTEVKRQLRQGLDARRGSLSARTAMMVDRNLAEIEASIDEIRKALQTEPGSRELRRQLMAAHRQEIYLLRQATEVAARL